MIKHSHCLFGKQRIMPTTHRGHASPGSRVLSLILLLGLTSNEVLAQAQPTRQDYLEHAEQVLADGRDVAAAWYRLIARLPAAAEEKDPPRAVRLALKEGLSGADLNIDLVSIEGKWVAGTGWARGWNSAIHSVTAMDFRSDDGDISCSLRVVLAPDGLVPFDGSPMECVYRLRVRHKAGLEGTFSTDGSSSGEPAVPKFLGVVTGAIRDVDADPIRPEELPKVDLADKHIAELYGAALGAYMTAASLFAHIRVLELARATGLSCSDVVRSSTACHCPAFPAYRESSDSGPAGRRPGAGAKSGTKPPADESRAKERWPAMKSIRECTLRIRQAAEAQDRADPAARLCAGGGMGTEDPHFGPWFGFQRLPRGESAPNALPADAGEEGLQNWPYVGGWRILGPFPAGDKELNAAFLPETLDAEAGTYCTDARALCRGYKGPDVLSWLPPIEPEKTGLLRPPSWRDADHEQDAAPADVVKNSAGIEHGYFYASSSIQSHKDAGFWMALGVDDFCKVWINDRLVATSAGGEERPTGYHSVLFRTRLRKGINRVTVRCDNDAFRTCFQMRICTRGQPRDEATAQARIAELEKRVTGIRHLPPGVRGWRNDWSGCYPGVNPVTAWDLSRRINLLWKVRMHFSRSSPLIVGDKLLTIVDPHTLVCMDKSDGKILWTRDSNILEILEPDLFSQYQEARRTLLDAEKQVRSLGRDEFEQLAALRKQGLGETDAKRKWDGLAGAEGGARKMLYELLAKCKQVVAMQGDEWGYSFPTPVTDGKRVWVKHGTGAVACYDMDGNRKWMVHAKHLDAGRSVCTSPLLVGGRLVIELAATADRGDPRVTLIGYDSATGKQVWSAPGENPGRSGSPVPMRVSDGNEEMDVVVTGGGTVVRAEDGRVLAPALDVDSGHGAPTAAADVVCHFGPRSATGYQLLMLSRDSVGAKPAWVREDTGPFDGGLAFRDGVLYGMEDPRWGTGYGMFEAKSGRQIHRSPDRATRTRSGGRPLMPAAVAGGCVFVSDDGTAPNGRKDGADLTVIQAGPDGHILAFNRIPDTHFCAAPGFDGDRVYLRTDSGICCIGYTGEEGRAWEAEENARHIIPDLQMAERPAETDARKINPPQQLPADLPRWSFANSIVTIPWNLLGPIPLETADTILDALGGPLKARISEKTQVRYQDKTYCVRALAFRGDARTWCGWERERWAVDLIKAVQQQTNSALLLFTVVENDKPRTVRLMMPTPDTDVWLAGVQVRHQDRISLEKGTYPLLVRSRIKTIPEEGMFLPMWFADSDDQGAEIRGWYDAVRKAKPFLDRVIRYRPESQLAAQARNLLARLQ